MSDDALYAQIPHVDCKGLCVDACGVIEATDAERERLPGLPLADDAQARYERDGHYHCPLLVAGLCSVYERRPLVCRLYGAVDLPVLVCPFGCTVTPRPLTRDEAAELVRQAGPTR